MSAPQTCPCWTDKKYVNAGKYCPRCKREMRLADVLRVTYPAIYDPFYLPGTCDRYSNVCALPKGHEGFCTSKEPATCEHGKPFHGPCRACDREEYLRDEAEARS